MRRMLLNRKYETVLLTKITFSGVYHKKIYKNKRKWKEIFYFRWGFCYIS